MLKFPLDLRLEHKFGANLLTTTVIDSSRAPCLYLTGDRHVHTRPIDVTRSKANTERVARLQPRGMVGTDFVYKLFDATGGLLGVITLGDRYRHRTGVVSPQEPFLCLTADEITYECDEVAVLRQIRSSQLPPQPKSSFFRGPIVTPTFHILPPDGLPLMTMSAKSIMCDWLDISASAALPERLALTATLALVVMVQYYRDTAASVGS